MKFLKSQIEQAAKDAGVSEIEIISIMQGECAKRGDEKSIEILHRLKMQYFKAK